MTTISKADFKLFIDWLKTKPAHETYEYPLPWTCLIAQYLKAQGHENVRVDPFKFHTKSIPGGRELPTPLDNIASGDANTTVYYYGDALKRAKKAFRKMYAN